MTGIGDNGVRVVTALILSDINLSENVMTGQDYKAFPNLYYSMQNLKYF